MHLHSKPFQSEELTAQARAMISLLPAVMRGLFRMDDDLATELPLAQLRVCTILQNGPQSMSTLSREVGVTLSAMTQIADRLERAKMVTRVSAGADRRVRRLQLTEHGEHLMRRRDEERLRAAQAALRQLAPEARDATLKNLEQLLQACMAAKENPDRSAKSIAERVGA
jgi:DNA-binding MarR family transcriptional regulator